MKIKVDYINPPIPTRALDYCAYNDGDEEKGEYGYGSTPEQAIADYKANYTFTCFRCGKEMHIDDYSCEDKDCQEK